MYKLAGFVNLFCAAWLFMFLAWALYTTLVLHTYISEHDPRHYTDPTYYFQVILQVGAFFVPILPLITFAFYYGNAQRYQSSLRFPTHLLLAVGIGLILSLMVTVVRTEESVKTLDMLGQSPFIAIGIWLVLASLKTFRQKTLPRVVSVSGFFVGISWVLWVFIVLLNWVNYDLSRTTFQITQVCLIMWTSITFIWAATFGLWLVTAKLE